MAKANKPVNNSKPRAKVSFIGVLMILVGADLILLMAPEVGILNSGFYIPDIYTWPALVAGVALLVFGFRRLYKKP
ncbi:MAG: hypothetical protein K9I59_03815 [Chlorobium sp.]|jgi:hypothetical protein|uniref:hypothetical protein n=1 Tax=Chlorobium sp. TaxID=1095 RepID=UPI001DA2B212|nr:hypothetical protein [Chlorobium sp.]MBN1278350.1 hypothetical protein [Chlorobiaceae bacterium]MCF8216556.1 hypothetical protein [Chlorobium sp.]MCF8270883.1 hypothetical protein [Chlorobium sp.]MCF8287183.1 hypothetical protein [Chlorobium sp.]MCF8290840.1 hypothetical protein [Chlorobium sp.]